MSRCGLPERRVWMAPALQAISAVAIVCQYSRVFPLPGSGLLANHERGLFAWQLPLALPLSDASIACRAVDEFRKQGSYRPNDL